MNLTKEETKFHEELSDLVKELSVLYRSKDISISWSMLLDEAKTIHRRRSEMNNEAEEILTQTK